METEKRLSATIEHHVIIEMLESEQRYNEKLVFLLAFLTQEELVQGTVLAGVKDTVSQLIATSDNLIKNVNEASQYINQEAETDTTHRNILKIQRTQLIRAFFTLYPTYNTLFTDFSKEAKASPERYKNIKKTLELNSKATLESFLVAPVQRGPLYSLLVKEAIAYNERAREGSKLSETQIADLKNLYEEIGRLLVKGNTETPEMNAPSGYVASAAKWVATRYYRFWGDSDSTTTTTSVNNTTQPKGSDHATDQEAATPNPT